MERRGSPRYRGGSGSRARKGGVSGQSCVECVADAQAPIGSSKQSVVEATVLERAQIPETPGQPGSSFDRLFLNCPRCGLSIRPRRSWLWLEYCPRCLGRSRIPVRLFSSPLPAAKLYADGSAPGVAQQSDPLTSGRESS